MPTVGCTNCYENCLKGITADLCVKYTGADNSTLGILSGDSLYTVLGILISTLGTGFSGDTVTISSIGASCTYFNTILNTTSLTIKNVDVAQVAAICDLNTRLVALNSQVNAAYSFDTDCLTLPGSTRDDILQGTIDEVCSLKTIVENIEDTYISTDNICALVTDCIAGSGGTQEYTKMSKYIAYPYHGPLSVFDSNGNGISGQGYSKVYMCLGQTVNGFTLPDYRGRAPVGANVNVPLSGIDSVVDPSLAANAGYGIALNTKKGEFKHTIISSELAAHTHAVTDPGHTHSMGGYYSSFGDDNNYTLLSSGGSTNTLASLTGITIGSTGNSQPMNVLSPSIGAIFVMYVP